MQGGGGGLLTPQTEGRRCSDHGYRYRVPGSYPGSFEVSPGRRMSASASTKAKARMMEEDVIDNSGVRQVSSFTDRLRRESGQGGQEQRQRQERLESFFSEQDSSRKTPRTRNVASPGRQKRGSDIEDYDDEVLQTQQIQQQQQQQQQTPERKRLSDPFFSSSPLQSLPQSQSFDICQTPTPTKYTNPLTTTTSMTQSSPAHSQPANLAHQAITLLENKGVVIARSTQEELAVLLNRHEMKMQGVIKGRDVTRMALKKREEEVERLRERVDALEVELRAKK